MTEQQWKTWTPKYDGHAPDDWDGLAVQFRVSDKYAWDNANISSWNSSFQYLYRAKQPDLLAQCLALPQADRDALIAELQKPVRDWADDVWDAAWNASWTKDSAPAAVIRSMCLSNHDPLLSDIYYFLGGTDGATELRAKLLKVIRS